MKKLTDFEKDLTLVIVCDEDNAKAQVLKVLTSNIGVFSIDAVELVEDMPVLVVKTSMIGYAYLDRAIEQDGYYQLIELGTAFAGKIFLRCGYTE